MANGSNRAKDLPFATRYSLLATRYSLLAAIRHSGRIFQAEGLRLVVVGKGFSKARPANDGTQGLLRGLRLHVVLELVEEAALWRRMARPLLQHASNVGRERHVGEQKPLKNLLAVVH